MISNEFIVKLMILELHKACEDLANEILLFCFVMERKLHYESQIFVSFNALPHNSVCMTTMYW